MIDSIEELRTFVRIVSAGSLSKAAISLDLDVRVVSKRLRSLEVRAGIKLINRTTRMLAPTEEGRELYERAEPILRDIDHAEDMLRGGSAEVSGILRVASPTCIGRRSIGPLCASLSRYHPKVVIDLILSDKPLDLFEERIDILLRFGDLRHPTAIVRKIADNHRVVTGAPCYIEQHGRPSSPDELVRHACLSHHKNEASWHLVGLSGEKRNVKITSALYCNEKSVIKDWTLRGMGLMMSDWIDVANDVESGRLMRVLEYWKSEPHPLFALYPANKKIDAKVKLFLEQLEAKFISPNGLA